MYKLFATVGVMAETTAPLPRLLVRVLKTIVRSATRAAREKEHVLVACSESLDPLGGTTLSHAWHVTSTPQRRRAL